MAKDEIKKKEKDLLELTGTFCAQKLNDEYFELCERLIKKMGRKRDVPFKRGRLEIWAAAVIHTIGSINFLGDKSFEPYLSSREIHDHFGTKSTTVSNKAGTIKDMFDLWYYNPEFSTDHMQRNNPFNDLVMVDDMIWPIDSLPEDMRRIARKAKAEGKDIAFTTRHHDG